MATSELAAGSWQLAAGRYGRRSVAKSPQRFRKLKIWNKAADFIVEVYRCTESFPDKEKYNLTAQIRRAVISISLNIAEGSACSTDREFARYLGIALSSSYEVMCAFEIAYRLKMCSKENYEDMSTKSDELAAMISGFIKTLNGRKSLGQSFSAVSC